jgi:hypothetical protein
LVAWLLIAVFPNRNSAQLLGCIQGYRVSLVPIHCWRNLEFRINPDDSVFSIHQQVTFFQKSKTSTPWFEFLDMSYSGLQALQRCSGLLNRRARGSTVATHHFGRKKDECRIMKPVTAAHPIHHSSFCLHHFMCIRGEITIILRFERRVCRWESCRMHQFRLRFAISDLTACGLPRTEERPVSETVNLGGAIPLTPTISPT